MKQIKKTIEDSLAEWKQENDVVVITEADEIGPLGLREAAREALSDKQVVWAVRYQDGPEWSTVMVLPRDETAAVCCRGGQAIWGDIYLTDGRMVARLADGGLYDLEALEFD